MVPARVNSNFSIHTARPTPIGRHELPVDGRVASLVSEVAAGAGVFHKLADNISGGIDEDPHGHVDVATNLLADIAWDVGQLLVEHRADNVGGLCGEVCVRGR